MTRSRCQGGRWLRENQPDNPWHNSLPNTCECGIRDLREFDMIGRTA